MEWLHPTPVLAAGIEGLIIFLVFVAISVLSNYLKRKRGEAETPLFDEEQTPPALPRRREPMPPRERPVAPPPATSWEEEIRRLLEGDQPTVPLPPPPVVREASPAPAPPPVRKRPEPEIDLESTPLPSLRRSPTPVIEAPRVELPTLTESAAAQLRASQISERVAQRFEHVDLRIAASPPPRPEVRRRSLAPDAAEFVRQLRGGRGARQAILATVILGPPKALDG